MMAYVVIAIFVVLYASEKYFNIQEKKRLESINDRLLDRLHGTLETPEQLNQKPVSKGKSPLNTFKKEEARRG